MTALESGDRDALVSQLLADEGFTLGRQAKLEPRSDRGPVPLAFAQERLWFLEQLAPSGGAFNMHFLRRLTGRLEVEILKQALAEVVRRHESLRTVFRSVQGVPVQVILEEASISLPVVDLRRVPGRDRERELARLTALQARTPFDLAAGPLLRAHVFHLEECEWAFLLVMHHIVSDGWSMGIIERELAAFYTALLTGQHCSLPPPRIQHADFALWQRQHLRQDTLQPMLAYWKRQLAGAPARLELPTDRPRPANQSFAGAMHAFSLSERLTGALRDLSRRESVSMFMLLVAAFQALLARYAQQEDVSVGTFVAGRTELETEDLVGFLVNNLVLRTDLSGDPSFRELLGRVRDVALGAFAHQEAPFERVIDHLQPQRTSSHTPLFQVMLVLQNTPPTVIEFPGLALRADAVPSQRSNFDLTLWVTECSGRLDATLQYSTALFDPSTIERIAGHLRTLLHGVTVNPLARLSELPLLTEQEERKLLVEWAAEDRPSRAIACVHQVVETQARRTPNFPAVVAADGQVSYRELNEKADRLGRRLREAGVGPESVVGVCMPSSAGMVIGMLGILKAGGAYLALDPSHGWERLDWMLQDSRARVVITQKHLDDRFAGAGVTTICLDTLTCLELADPVGDDAASPGIATNGAYLMYTSGSTGTPKGVLVEHGGLVNFVESAVAYYALKPSDRVLQLCSTSFDISVEEIFCSLASGATLAIADPTMRGGVATLLSACERLGITVLDLPTAYWHELVAAAEATATKLPSGLRLIIVGGERLEPESLAAWHRLSSGSGCRLLNTYGPTEATVVTTWFDASQATGERSGREVPLGRPLPNVEVFVLDRHLRPVPIGCAGEVYIGGAGLARGYLGRPALTAERFLPHPFTASPGARLYRTGDLARYRADGNLEFVGRADGQVKIRGFRVEPGEVEAVLARHPAVASCVVVAQEDGPGDRRLVAYAGLVPGGRASSEELRRFAAQDLPDYMAPAAVMVLDALPLTPNGKIDRKALPAPSRSGHAPRPAKLAPQTTTERELARIWEELLGIDSIGITESFFELGGDSLMAVRLMARLQNAFGHDLPLATLLEEPTIERLAALLNSAPQSAAWSPLVSIRSYGARPPLYCVHPAGGTVLCYAGLARELGDDRPLIGLQAVGLDEGQAPRESINEIAQSYVKAVRRHQPHDPYLIAGWSMGGLIALAMAQVLLQQGDEVGLIVLLDSPALFDRPPRPEAALAGVADDTALLARFVRELTGPEANFGLDLSSGAFRRLGLDEQLRCVVDHLRTADLLDTDEAQIGRLYRVFRANVLAAVRYTPQPYYGRAVYFRAADQPHDADHTDARAWKRVIPRLAVRTTPGDHETMIGPRHVEALGKSLRDWLRRSDESTCSANACRRNAR